MKVTVSLGNSIKALIKNNRGYVWSKNRYKFILKMLNGE